MKKRIFAVHDSALPVWGAPFTVNHLQEAMRGFQRAALDPSSDLHLFAANFTLHELGEFDDETGLVTLHSQPIFVARATQFQITPEA